MGIKSPMAEKDTRNGVVKPGHVDIPELDGWENHHLLPCPMKPEGIYYVHKLREYPHIYIYKYINI